MYIDDRNITALEPEQDITTQYPVKASVAAEDIKDVVVVGSGPAGLSAALYTSRAGLSTSVVKGLTAGGLVTSTEEIDNYLGMPGVSGIDMSEKFLGHSQMFGAQMIDGVVDRIVKRDDGVFETHLSDTDEALLSRSVVFAAGSEPRKLSVSGSELSGVSYCATCDGMFFADESVAVVGGGESAVEEASYLANLCSRVDVFVRSSWRASKPAVERLKALANVFVHEGVNVAEIKDSGSGEVSGVVGTDGVTYPVSGVFVAVGQIPNSRAADGNVELYSDGFIHKSTTEGFFIAGDVSDPDFRQVAVAVGSGAKAGISATRFVLSDK